MEAVSDENIETLCCMGFVREQAKQALRYAKNDLNEAVSILTGDHPTGLDTLYGLDSDSFDNNVKSTGTGPGSLFYGPSLPPSYDEVIDDVSSGRTGVQQAPQDKEEAFEFPVPYLYELENRVFTESWSIPYKREESLGKCLLAATRLAQEGLCDTDTNCSRFLDKCMPEAFNKLLTSAAVHRWGIDIQEGIFDMLQLLIDLIAVRLQHFPIPVDILHVLAMVFNMESEYNTKNRQRIASMDDKQHWEDVFGSGKQYAITSLRDSYGWLTDLINRFAEKKGFQHIKERLTGGGLDATSMAALLAPFGNCVDVLNPTVVSPILSDGVKMAVAYVKNLEESDFKDKKVGNVCDMLATIKLIVLRLAPDDVQQIDDLRFSVVLRMLKSPHFNARMNALKEVTKLIEDSKGPKVLRSAISHDRIVDWLVDEKILSIALEGNIDQGQYCEKIKNIVDFLGMRLSLDELTAIWKMQNSEATIVVDNIHSIVAAAAVKFNAVQIENLVALVKETWNEKNDIMREKLLRFIGGIGRECKNVKTLQRLLEILWDLAHLPFLKTSLVELALEEHLAILSDPFSIKDLIKKQYAVKCVEDIREGKWVLPALKQLLHIAKVIAKNSYHKAEKGILQELNKNYEIIKQVTNSLMKFHQLTATSSVSRDSGGDFAISSDRRYSHQDFVTAHLSFLQFILQEGSLYLPWHRARDIWDTLVNGPHSIDWDRDTCYEWFSKGIADLEADTQGQLFQKEILKLDINRLSQTGFACFKCFFENVNQNENKLKKTTNNTLVIEKTDLIGLDFLWKICMNTPDVAIAESAITLLLTVSYISLAPRFRRDAINLHKKFIDECYKWLEAAMIPLEGSTVAHALLQATKILSAVSIPQGSSLPSPSRSANLLNIERLLLIAERYIVSVEELHTIQRSILPHGASFQGQPLNLNVVCEAHKRDFTIQAHSNETVGSVRQKIGKVLKLPPEQIQFLANEKMPNKDHKLLSQLDFDDNQQLNVRIICTLPVSSFSSSQLETGGSLRMSLDLEEEKMLPGVIMSNGGQVFEMLYHLVSLDQPRITNRAWSLLQLIPTDPSIVEALDSIGQKNLIHRQHSSSGAVVPDKEPSPKLSPHSSPRRLFGVVPTHSASQNPSVGSRGTSPTTSSCSSTLKGSSSTASLTSIGSGTLPRPAASNARETLRNMLNTSTPGLTVFQVLYNLEVISSRLMPTTAHRDQATMQSSRKFCEDFLDANGLTLILNILHKDAMRPEVDYHTRQGCYVLCLQLLRYLLCGQDVTGEAYQSGVTGGTGGFIRRCSTDSAASSGLSSGPPSLELGQLAAGKCVQTMSISEFTDTLSCFIRVAWAAAAGKLQLVGTLQPVKDSNLSDPRSSGFNCRETSIGSIGSGASSGSENDVTSLQAGLCARQQQVSSTDAYIAKEALELLVTCLQLRSSLLSVFYSLTSISEFIIEVLVGSPQSEIRQTAVQQFLILSQSLICPTECSGHQPTPRQFLLQILLKARLPFWVASTVTRGASYRLLKQCKQYFELKCKLMANLSVGEQESMQLNIRTMLEDEIVWLSNFVPSDGASMSVIDNALLAGHLQSIRTLLTCAEVDKKHFGQSLVQDLLHEFLFPSSKIIMDASLSTLGSDNALATVTPKCSNSESRVAAYDVLVELANGNLENLSTISKELINMHHQQNPELASLWEHLPPVDGRSVAGFVGLKNGGATCYMNSVIQQLYMMPGIAEYILSIDDENVNENSVLYQIQSVLGHLMESKLQFYTPERFWQVFRLWADTPVNIREQQDALDFFQAVIDQIDEQTKKLGKEAIFKKNFQGFFSDQKICKDCPHRYEQEEMFFSLNVTVKNATLQDSLDQFVKGELLEGSNAYFCEKCGVKRNTVKRLCIKTLPPVLCIQLKRFDYDWESNRAIKFDDYFKFPLVLDMEPYTAEGMAWREAQTGTSSSADVTESTTLSRHPSVVVDTPSPSPIVPTTPTKSGENKISDPFDAHPMETDDVKGVPLPSTTTFGNGLCVAATTSAAVGISHINYELVGIVVHSGQANAGHYYSFIKDRRGNYMSNPNKGKWYRFNDTSVEEFEMTEESLESECFGGKYKAKVFDNTSVNSQPEERLRYWNGYLLFYERMEDVRTPVSAKKSKVTMWRSPSDKTSFGPRQDSLKQLTDLVHKGEKKGLFSNKMPARIQHVVREENLMFLRNRNLYDLDYFTFIRNLASKNTDCVDHDNYTSICMESLNLSIKFLFNTYFHTKSKLRSDLEDWASLVTSLLQQSKSTCSWMVEFLACDGSSSIKPLLLECSSKEIRETFGKLLEKTMCSYFQMGGVSTHKFFNEIVEILLAMLQRDVPDNCRQSQQYFQVLLSYVQMGIKACSHMFLRNGFKRLMEFLVGPCSGNSEASSRRWSSLQARDFGALHATLATLILNCDVAHAQTEDIGTYQPFRPVMVTAQKYLKMSADMTQLVFGLDSNRYLREVVLTFREVTSGIAIDVIEEMLMYLSFCNAQFSFNILKMLVIQCITGPCNELKPLFHCLMQLLLLEDPLQLRRIKFVIEGPQSQSNQPQDDQIEGMLAAVSHYHTSDSRRSYQIIKFLVNIASRCTPAKDYLLQTTSRWQWAVNWLRSKMTDHYWNSQTASSTSNEDSTVQTFQRTVSAQDTLACATAMLTEATEQLSDMEVGTSGSAMSGSSGLENEETTSVRSKSSSPVVFNTGTTDDYDTVDKQL